MSDKPTPDPERLRGLNRLLEVALALPQDARDNWLRALPSEHQSFVPLVQGLLARAAVETDTFMRQPVAASFADLDDAGTSADRSGDEVGPYRLIRELGAGGMATVWLAERADGVLHRQVALKLPSAGWAQGLAQRMARERDILGALEHPRIARLYDASVTADGRPWMAMEYVSGVTIDVYCADQRLDVPQRLRLWLQVAGAVAHAHARLIVHRDLKPSNILVTSERPQADDIRRPPSGLQAGWPLPATRERAGARSARAQPPEGDEQRGKATFAHEGEVRLLDFGVAKLLEGDSVPAANVTQMMGRALTPDYASPEQLSGKPVTVATDVYSLGVVLYELLTGARPEGRSRPFTAAIEEATLAVDAPPASTRVTHDKKLARQLSGDIDTVLAKALRRDVGQRYPSVESMAADIQRHLDGEPVLAQPFSRWYRTAKFMRRNRLVLSASGAVAVALVVGLGMALWQGHEARLQRELALTRLTQTESALEFATTVLTEGIGAEERLTLDELLQRSEKMAEGGSGTSPMARAVATDEVADWLMSFARYPRAEELLKRTLNALPTGFDPSMTHALACKRAEALAELGRLDEGLRILTAAIDAGAGDDSTMARCLETRARMARNNGDPTAALRFVREAMRHFDASGRSEPSAKALLQAELAFALLENGRPGEADRQFSAAAQTFQSAGRGDSRDAVTVYNNWGIALLSAGDPRAALAQFDHAMATVKRVSPNGEVPEYLLANRALSVYSLARFDQAREAYNTVLKQARLGGRPADQLFALNGLAAIQQRVGDVSAAQRLLDEGAALLAGGQVSPNSNASTAHLTIQSRVWQSEGRLADARRAATEVLDLFAKDGVKVGAVAGMLILRSELLAAEGRAADALADAEQALEAARSTQGDRTYSYLTGQAWLALAKLHHAAGREGPAREAVAQAINHMQAMVDADHPFLLEARQLAAALQ